MGMLWFLAMIPYGMGAYYLGRLGTSVGWAINIAASLIIANSLGFLTGEWKAASTTARRVLFTGLAVLVGAMVLLAKGNSLAPVHEQTKSVALAKWFPVMKHEHWLALGMEHSYLEIGVE
jgi:hypothetical protein